MWGCFKFRKLIQKLRQVVKVNPCKIKIIFLSLSLWVAAKCWFLNCNFYLSYLVDLQINKDKDKERFSPELFTAPPFPAWETCSILSYWVKTIIILFCDFVIIFVLFCVGQPLCRTTFETFNYLFSSLFLILVQIPVIQYQYARYKLPKCFTVLDFPPI